MHMITDHAKKPQYRLASELSRWLPRSQQTQRHGPSAEPLRGLVIGLCCTVPSFRGRCMDLFGESPTFAHDRAAFKQGALS